VSDAEVTPRPAPGHDPLLDAARDSILAVGWKRTTLTDVARRAAVSRMTIYRRWSDMQSLMADLMTREWGGLLGATLPADAVAGSVPAIAETVAATVGELRRNELFTKIVEVDPELLLPYLLARRGRTQDALLTVLVGAVAEGQRAGSVRDGDPALLARSVLLASYGFALSARTMTGEGVDESSLDAELRMMTERYLSR
jgi:AcrR family transcriptional regulator